MLHRQLILDISCHSTQQERLRSERHTETTLNATGVRIGEYFDDPELERLYEERLAALKETVERRANRDQGEHGTYQDITEEDFLEVVTRTKYVIAHFYEPSFARCAIMDRHLEALAAKHVGTRFIAVMASNAPFFVEKLKVRILPCIFSFIDGVVVDKIVGFEDLGSKDDFEQDVLESRFVQSGVIKPLKVDEGVMNSSIRQSFATLNRTASDEDSDFD